MANAHTSATCDVQEVTSWTWGERSTVMGNMEIDNMANSGVEYRHKRCLTHDEDVPTREDEVNANLDAVADAIRAAKFPRKARLMTTLQETGSAYVSGYTLAEVVDAVQRLGLDPSDIKVRGTLSD